MFSLLTMQNARENWRKIKNKTHHESLNQATNDTLQGHDNHGRHAFIGGLSGAIADGVLGLQRKKEARGKIFDLQYTRGPTFL